MLYTSLFLCFSVAITSFALPTSDSSKPMSDSSDWTYQDAYRYALQKGGKDDPVALLIASHVNVTGRDWTESYKDDIKGPGNSTFTLSHSLRGRAIHDGTSTMPAGIEKRDDYDGTSLTVYPWVSNCDDAASFTYSPIPKLVCVSDSTEYGHRVRMYSFIARGGFWDLFDVGIALQRDGDTCPDDVSDFTWQSLLPSGHCGDTSDGRGFMMWTAYDYVD
jgi:hypothetical protein